MRSDFVKQLRTLLESEVDEAEIIIAIKGIGKNIQDMIEKIGRLQNEDLPPLSEQMRDTYGTPVASEFQTTTSQSLQVVMDSLYASKENVDTTVQKLASGGGAEIDMDVDIDPRGGGDEFGMGGDELGLGGDELGMGIDDELGLDDEFGGAESGPLDEPLGRIKKESIMRMGKKLAKMQKQVAKAKAQHLQEKSNV